MEEVKEVKEEEGRRRKKARKKTEVKKKGKGRREKRKARRAGPPLIHPNSRSPAPGGCILIMDDVGRGGSRPPELPPFARP